MTVYFIQRVGDPTQVKIGCSDNLPHRLREISSAFEEGIELLAQCDGGTETEKAFHVIYERDRLEGEWFRRTPDLDRLVASFSGNVKGRRIWGRLRAVADMKQSPLDTDRELAHLELKALLDSFGRVPTGRAIEMAFEVLSQVNPMWTRRRVRAIWEMRARRIDLYEMRDLQKATSQAAKQVGGRNSAGIDGRFQ